ncbi:Rieske (2Fe-2S) protein [Actinoplanes couchii]|uniref:Cytochrome bc1 complex Rieske iron-sulfur subunit n=1 Tax=Actinoplanes couchii TaxID=403638 RepID=A0ABQ3X2J7_9ACTN|nr:Rieske (2Fe-2S) protein [Actinoplanes couchii]MDR6322515.1 Rieske Fe-S protein [Actinoplanes couchii]GID52747.1 iron-sulfur protein [Actinoplanes couchii]
MTDVQQRTEAETPQDRPGTASSRRGVLLTAGALGATAALAACGTDASGTNPNGSDFAAEPAPAGSEGAGSGSTGGGSTGGGGTVLVAASKVEVGGGVILDEVVVTQPKEGTFKAFSNVCTHQGCKVTEIAGGSINCKCHGAKYSLEDGSPTSGPAKQALAATEVTVDGDNIVTA